MVLKTRKETVVTASEPKKLPANPSYREPEIIEVPGTADQAACDGGGGPLGHPIVYYKFDNAEEVTCGYCDRVFKKSPK